MWYTDLKKNYIPSMDTDENKSEELRNQEEMNEKDILDIQVNKETAAASYLLIFAPLLLVTRKDSKFIMFHAKQAFVLALIFVILWVLGGYFFLFRYATVFVVFAALIGFLQAIAGHKYSLPLVDEIVKNGFSIQKIFASLGKIFSFVRKIFVGALPQKLGKKLEEKTPEIITQNLEKRVKQLEKIVEELQKK